MSAPAVVLPPVLKSPAEALAKPGLLVRLLLSTVPFDP
jgi:hypothetical protein